MAKYKTSPFSEAYSKKDIKKMEELVRKGTDINQLDSDKRTVLMQAAADNNIPVAQFLLQQGADPDLKDQAGWTALHFAAQNYSFEMAKLLLDHKSEIDPRDDYGNTPLWKGVFNSRGRGEVIHLLLSRGADRNAKNDGATSPLDLARSISNFNVRQFLE